MTYYAGVGSRETPPEILARMTRISTALSSVAILRSGAAVGADTAFENGAEFREIFLPWRGYNGSDSSLYIGNKNEIPESYVTRAMNIVSSTHPRPSALSYGALKLHARNVFIILGKNLNNPVRFCICWTKGGKVIGGTGMAIRICNLNRIPVFNLADPDYSTDERLIEDLPLSYADISNAIDHLPLK
jgi:hypothetical protein